MPNSFDEDELKRLINLFVTGFLVFALATGLDKNNNSLGDTDIEKILPEILERD